MSKELTAAQVKDMLSGFNVVSKNKGTYKAKKSYFYTGGMTPEKLAEGIKKVFPDAEIINKGNQWRPFCGGAVAGGSKDSYMWVEFKLPKTA